MHDVPNSMYFTHFGTSIKSAQADIRTENDRRLVETDSFLSNYSPIRNDQSQQLDVIITVVSVSRNRNSLDSYKPRYLTQTVASLHRALYESGYNASLFLCNVDSDPTTYDEAIAMKQYFSDVFSRFSSARYTGDHHRLEKEKQDYAYCMQRSLDVVPGVNNILILEDDALPHKDMFPLLDHTITNRLSTQSSNDRTAYVKFFHPQWLIGYWSLDASRLSSLWALSVLMSVASFCLESKLREHKKIQFAAIISKENSSMRLLLWFLYYCILFISIGLYSILSHYIQIYLYIS